MLNNGAKNSRQHLQLSVTASQQGLHSHCCRLLHRQLSATALHQGFHNSCLLLDRSSPPYHLVLGEHHPFCINQYSGSVTFLYGSRCGCGSLDPYL
jgi:hypothetical protein